MFTGVAVGKAGECTKMRRTSLVKDMLSLRRFIPWRLLRHGQRPEVCMRKAGYIEPVVFFARRDGYVMLAPYTSAPIPPGYIRLEADTLHAVDLLERKLQQQEAYAAEQELILDLSRTERASQEIRDRLYSRMTSGSTPQWEKDFLREYLKLRDERKRQKYAERHKQLWFLWARHNDSGNRRVDVEEFNVEKHTVIDG
jgi:hypothetical protein